MLLYLKRNQMKEIGPTQIYKIEVIAHNLIVLA